MGTQSNLHTKNYTTLEAVERMCKGSFESAACNVWRKKSLWNKKGIHV